MKITTTSSTGNMNSEMAAPCDTSPEVMPVWKPAKPRTEVAPTGTAHGHQKDDGQIGEREHDAENQADGHDRQNHRHDDLVVAPPETGAVDGRRVEYVLWDRGDAGEEDDDGKGKEAPGIDDDHRQHRQIRVAKPVRRLLAGDEAKRDQRPVDDAVERIEHPLPGDRGERDRHRPGQYDQRPDEFAAGERPQQHQRAELAEDEAEDLRSEGEDEGVVKRLPE